MGMYLVMHTPIKHASVGQRPKIYDPGDDIELTAKEARRLGDNVRPKIREARAEPETEEWPEAESPIPLEDMTVAKITEKLKEKGITDISPKVRKAQLIEMLRKVEAEEKEV